MENERKGNRDKKGETEKIRKREGHLEREIERENK